MTIESRFIFNTVSNLPKAAVEFLIKVIAVADHQDNRVTADNFISDPIRRATDSKSINKKPAKRAVEWFAGTEIIAQIRDAIFSRVFSRGRKPPEIFFGGRREKNLSHNLASRNNFFESFKFAGSKKFSGRVGPPLNFLNNGGVPKKIFAYYAPQFLNLSFQFLNPIFSRGSHMIKT